MSFIWTRKYIKNILRNVLRRVPVVCYGKEKKDLHITKWLVHVNTLCENTYNHKEDQRLYRERFSDNY